MIIKILGPGCPNCLRYEANVREAVKELGLDADIQKVKDYAAISAYGVMSTPGLVIDEKVVSYGKVLPVDAIKKLIQPGPGAFSANLK